MPLRTALSSRRVAVALASIPALSLLAGAIAVPQAGQNRIQATLVDFFVPGTQPLSLNQPIFDSTNCAACHSGYAPLEEPFEMWAASMMGQAGRDPIFYATLAIAEQDVAFGGDTCLRCHAPGAWLDGRSVPTNGSGLDPSLGDLDGVTCHFCHRMVDPVPSPANPAEDPSILAALTPGAVENPHSGSYVIDPDDNRRGPYSLVNFFFHEWRESPFHRESLMCATCHDVSNPLLELQMDGSWQLGPLGAAHPSADKSDQFPIERTFSEWATSVYAQAEIDTGGRFGGDRPTVSSCQDCHMPDTQGTGCNPGLNPPVRSDLPQHAFAGANSWVLRAIRSQYPDFETGLSTQSVDDAIARNEAMLQAAADLEAVVDGTELVLRVTNVSGHKLPTGYGEGRRMWVDARFYDINGQLLQTRGGYDPITADLDESTTTVYGIDHGIDAQMAMATGLPVGKSLHFLLNNTIEKDNRIPARGFRPDVYEAIGSPVVGTVYDPEQYWSETRFTIPPGADRADVRLLHQTTSKEYIEFLRNENTTNMRGQEAYDLWNMFGRSEPVEMAARSVPLRASNEFEPRPLALGKERAGGLRPELTLSGSTSWLGGGATLHVSGGPANTLTVLFASPVQASQDVFNGVLNVGPGSMRIATLNLDSNGEATIPVSYSIADEGRAIVYQALFRDVGASFNIGMTNGLRVDVTR